MSDCKITKNMGPGDIIFLVVAALSLMFSLINSSNKQKKRREEQEKVRQRTNNQTPNKAESDEDWWLTPSTVSKSKVPPPYVRKEFQSSIGSMNYGEESSSFNQPSSGRNIEKRGGRKITRASSIHPLLSDLMSDSGATELKKGFIYSEILQRKY